MKENNALNLTRMSDDDLLALSDRVQPPRQHVRREDGLAYDVVMEIRRRRIAQERRNAETAIRIALRNILARTAPMGNA